MKVGQLMRLAADGLRDFRPSVANIDAIEACESVNQFAVFSALIESHSNAAGATHDRRRDFAVGEVGNIGARVQDGGVILMLQIG